MPTMIAEHFYPKELKGVIADLQVKAILDGESLDQMNRSIKKRIIVGVGFSIFIVLLSLLLDHVYSILLVNILALYSIYSVLRDVYSDLKIFPVLYSLNSRTEGIVTRIFDTGIITVVPVCSWGLGYEYSVNGNQYTGRVKEIKNYL